ncbi:MAG: hypothetical protein KDE27_04935, partial [Planctomycetes bacterium]|nr:hypothetical protein [Planctomycetota bacterium]
MRISQKITLGFGGTTALLLVCAGSGVLGLRRLGDSVAKLSGPAWDTADGAMETTIGIQADMLVIEQVLDDRDENSETRLQAARAMSDEAATRLANAGLLPEDDVAQFRGLERRRAAAVAKLLRAQTEFTEARAELDRQIERCMAVGEVLEGIGDQAVEGLEKDPQREVSWSNGLEPLWTAADGGMECSIGMLTQIHFLHVLAGSTDPGATLAEIRKAQSFHEEAMGPMLATGRFDLPLPAELGSGGTLADAYRAAVTAFGSSREQYIRATVARRESKAEYERASSDLLEFLGGFEERADAVVDEESASIQTTRTSLLILMTTVSIASLGLAIAAAWWILHSTSRPLRALANA